MQSRLLTRTALAFLAAALTGWVVGTVFYTTNNLIRLADVGVQIGVGDALRTFWFDLLGMAPSWVWTQYGSVIVIGLAIAFPVAAFLRRLAARHAWTRLQPALYPLAGATAMAMILLLSYQQYEVFAYPGGRFAPGVITQCLAGALAGFVFQRLAAKPEVA